MFTLKKILLGITRNKGRSLILVAFSFFVVLIIGIYIKNLTQNQNLLNALGTKIPVMATITNPSGDRLTGLDITEKRIALFLELGLKECVITAESYGNIGISSENTEKRISIHLTGTNTASSMVAWKPKFSLTDKKIDEILSGKKGLCLLNESYMQERGMTWQIGDMVEINLYRALYDKFDNVSRFVEITSAKLEIAGFYQTAQESALEAVDLVCPLTWLAEQYQLAGNQLLYSSAKGIVENPLALNELKAKAEKLKFPQIDVQSTGGRSGNTLVIDDRVFIQTASQLKDSIRLLRLFLIPVIILVIGMSASVCFFATCYRKQEIYLERCMGRKKVQIMVEVVGEHLILAVVGGVIALQLTKGKFVVFSLFVFLWIQIMTTLITVIWLSMKSPMRIFWRIQ